MQESKVVKNELVDRAVRTSEILFDTIKKKGWFSSAPSLKEIEESISKEERAKTVHNE